VFTQAMTRKRLMALTPNLVYTLVTVRWLNFLSENHRIMPFASFQGTSSQNYLEHTPGDAGLPPSVPLSLR
jgi:hypothetical protein